MNYGDPHLNYGWINDPIAVSLMVARMSYPRLREAAPDLMATVRDQDALLYQACQKVTGGNLPAHKQTIGCCVSEGYSSAVDYLQCVEIALKGDLEEYKPVSHAAIYGMARELGNMLGGEDGLVGAYAAQCVSTLGVVTNDEARDSDTEDALAGQWGQSGCPDAIKQSAKNHIVKSAAGVKSAAEAQAALTNGYPVAICSDQGFSMTRDQDGFCQPQGHWNHCLLGMAYRADRRGFCILQSWGPNVPSGPTALGQPDCSFWADWGTVDGMLQQGDSFMLSNFIGFPAQTLSWLI